MNKFLLVFVATLGSSYGKVLNQVIIITFVRKVKFAFNLAGYFAKGYFEKLARSWMSIPGGGSTTTVAPVMADNLIITGVIDGPITGGLPKAVELYVGNDIPDLSIYGLGSATNGGGTDGQEFSFPVGSSATAGQYIYVASEQTEFAAYFGFDPDYTASAVNVNGDDAIELFENLVAIDVFGDISTDGSGQPWEYLDGWAYRSSGTAATTTFSSSEWMYSGPNALDGGMFFLIIHTTLFIIILHCNIMKYQIKKSSMCFRWSNSCNLRNTMEYQNIHTVAGSYARSGRQGFIQIK